MIGRLLLLVAVLGACASGARPATNSSTPAVDSATVRAAGAYLGTLPCGDCAGIETALLLRADASFQLATRRLETPRDSAPSVRGPLQVQHGRVLWNRARTQLTLDSVFTVVRRFDVRDGALSPLDSLTNAPLPDRHTLRKSAQGRTPSAARPQDMSAR
jgi:hypothetical protein